MLTTTLPITPVFKHDYILLLRNHAVFVDVNGLELRSLVTTYTQPKKYSCMNPGQSTTSTSC